MKYTLVCDVPSHSYVQHHSNGTLRCSDPSNINSQAGELIVVPYAPSMSELTQAERLEVIGVFFMLVLLGYLAGIAGSALINFIYKSLGWR